MPNVEYTGRQTGPVTLYLETQAADIEVIADPRVTGSWIELSTTDESGPAVEAIRRADFRDHGHELRLTLREGTTGGMVIRTGGGVTIVNGRVITGSSSFSQGRITVRAALEPGSKLVAKTMSGDVTVKNMTTVDANTMSGDIDVEGVAGDSRLKSMSGDIHVTGRAAQAGEIVAVGDRGPRVSASTMSGDVTGAGVDLSASSMSGRVRQR